MSSAAPFGDTAGLYEGFDGGFGCGHGGHGFSQLGASTSSVLLDGKTEKEPDATAMEMPKRKGGGERDEKAAMALKSHSEAERRRRERINAHLATLRSMVPCTDNMDKAALLAEVINHVKKLKNNAARIGKHCPVPSDTDEVTVEVQQEAPHSTIGNNGGGRFLIRATLSCDDCADLFADVKRAMQPLKLKVVGSEVTTLGGRVRLTFLMSCEGDVTVASVHQALKSVLDKVNSADDFAPRESLLNKRRRVLTFEYSSSSS